MTGNAKRPDALPAPQHNAALVSIDIDDALSGTPPASARQPRKHFLHIAIAIDGGQEGFDFFELLGAQDGNALAQQGTTHHIELDDAQEMAEQLK